MPNFFQFLSGLPVPVQIFVGIVIMLLGCSFAYKAFVAIIRGKVTYWTGFLPFTIISPFLIHLPRGKKSLIIDAEGLWVHMLMGPVFGVASFFCLLMGADIVGLSATDMINDIMSRSRTNNGLRAIEYDRATGYRFPIAHRVGNQLQKLIFKSKMDTKDKYYEDPAAQQTLDQAMH